MEHSQSDKLTPPAPVIVIAVIFYFFHFEAALRNQQAVYRKCLGIVMQGQLEPVHQHALEHKVELPRIGGGRRFGGDIEPFAVEPVRPHHLVIPHLVSTHDQAL